MERFAYKIDERVKLSLYKICRLCGIDNREQVVILEDKTILCEDEPNLCRKVLDCVGISVSETDNMPQKMCTLCRDKIYDFFEYREMCKQTDSQTRQLLGLPKEEPKEQPVVVNAKNRKRVKTETIKLETEPKSEVLALPNEKMPNHSNLLKIRKVGRPKQLKKAIPPASNQISHSQQAKILTKSLKLKSQPTVVTTEKTKPAVKLKPTAKDLILGKKEERKRLQRQLMPTASTSPLAKKSKTVVELKVPKIESEETNAVKLEVVPKLEAESKKRLRKDSVPSAEVPTKRPKITQEVQELIFCIVCAKQFQTQSVYDIHFFREHTPYTLEYGCVACREGFYTIQELRDHQMWHRISATPFSCFRCNEQFDRITGYTRHTISSCIPPPPFTIVADITCERCKKNFQTENLYNWHDCFIRKNGKCRRCGKGFAKKLGLFKHSVACTVPYKRNVEKPVAKKIKKVPPQAVISNEGSKTVKTEPGSILEIDNDRTISEQVPQPNDILEKEPIIYNETPVAPPAVRIKEEPIDIHYDMMDEQQLSPAVRIKQEPLDAGYGDEEQHTETEPSELDQELLANIKSEPQAEATTSSPSTSPIKPTLKLKIKLEHGTLNSSFIDHGTALDSAEHDIDESELNTRKRKHKKKKKIFKIPKQLAMILQKEKSDALLAATTTGSDETIEPIENIMNQNPDVRVPVIMSVISLDRRASTTSTVPVITSVTSLASDEVQYELPAGVTIKSEIEDSDMDEHCDEQHDEESYLEPQVPMVQIASNMAPICREHIIANPKQRPSIEESFDQLKECVNEMSSPVRIKIEKCDDNEESLEENFTPEVENSVLRQESYSLIATTTVTENIPNETIQTIPIDLLVIASNEAQNVTNMENLENLDNELNAAFSRATTTTAVYIEHVSNKDTQLVETHPIPNEKLEGIKDKEADLIRESSEAEYLSSAPTLNTICSHETLDRPDVLPDILKNTYEVQSISVENNLCMNVENKSSESDVVECNILQKSVDKEGVNLTGVLESSELEAPVILQNSSVEKDIMDDPIDPASISNVEHIVRENSIIENNSLDACQEKSENLNEAPEQRTTVFLENTPKVDASGLDLESCLTEFCREKNLDATNEIEAPTLITNSLPVVNHYPMGIHTPKDESNEIPPSAIESIHLPKSCPNIESENKDEINPVTVDLKLCGVGSTSLVKEVHPTELESVSSEESSDDDSGSSVNDDSLHSLVNTEHSIKVGDVVALKEIKVEVPKRLISDINQEDPTHEQRGNSGVIDNEQGVKDDVTDEKINDNLNSSSVVDQLLSESESAESSDDSTSQDDMDLITNKVSTQQLLKALDSKPVVHEISPQTGAVNNFLAQHQESTATSLTSSEENQMSQNITQGHREKDVNFQIDESTLLEDDVFDEETDLGEYLSSNPRSHENIPESNAQESTVTSAQNEFESESGATITSTSENDSNVVPNDSSLQVKTDLSYPYESISEDDNISDYSNSSKKPFVSSATEVASAIENANNKPGFRITNLENPTTHEKSTSLTYQFEEKSVVDTNKPSDLLNTEPVESDFIPTTSQFLFGQSNRDYSSNLCADISNLIKNADSNLEPVLDAPFSAKPNNQMSEPQPPVDAHGDIDKDDFESNRDMLDELVKLEKSIDEITTENDIQNAVNQFNCPQVSYPFPSLSNLVESQALEDTNNPPSNAIHESKETTGSNVFEDIDSDLENELLEEK